MNSWANYKGYSLHQGSEKGPDFLNDLTYVIRHCRSCRVPFLGDVPKIFSQIQLATEEKETLMAESWRLSVNSHIRMDDITGSCDNADEAKEVIHKIEKILGTGS